MKNCLKALLLLIALAGTGAAEAETLGKIVKKGVSTFKNLEVNGYVRSYYFTRRFGPSSTTKKHDLKAFSLATRLNVMTDPSANGFGLGATLLTAQSLGMNNPLPGNTDNSLMGPTSEVYALGQLYVQYRQPRYMVRLGPQMLHIPWMGKSDTRAMPASYEAALLDIAPIDHLHIYAVREYKFKSRTSGHYFRDNLYYPHTWGGDSSYGGQPFTVSATAPGAEGTLAFGATYANRGLKVQAWYLNFYKFAHTFYGHVKYTVDTGASITPFFGIQYLRQKQSNSMFSQQNVTANGLGGNVNTTVDGARAGVNIPHGNIYIAYNKVFFHADAFGGGQIISPFTNNYATDPLWTTSMLRGLVELGPGRAWKIKGTYKVLHDQLKLVTAYTEYYTHFKSRSNNLYFNATYSFSGAYKGLSLRDRIEISRGHAANGANRFIYNRVMIQYNF